MAEGFPDWIGRLFQGFAGAPSPAPAPRLDRLPFGLHLISGGSSVELFPPGPLDVLRFHQRHHSSLHHDVEYVVARPEGASAEDYSAYAVFRLRPEARVPLVEPREVERELRASYGTLVNLPRARALFERPYSDDLADGDPPEGLNGVVAPADEKPRRDRFSTRELLEIIRKELTGPQAIAWLEGAFRQPPRAGRAEHRYYVDAQARLYLVRDHPQDGKTLYRAEVSAKALRPERFRR